MGAVNSDQQLENAATRSDRVGSVADVNEELSILGIGHWKDYQSRSVYRDSDDGERDCTRQ